MSLTSGTRLGPYEIANLIGAGGMGEVYRAHDTRLGRDVAIKVLPGAFAQDADRLARFEREAKSIAALSHQNILAIHDTGTHDGHVDLSRVSIRPDFAAGAGRFFFTLEDRQADIWIADITRRPNR